MNYDYRSIFDEKLPLTLNEFNNYLMAIKGKSSNTIKAYTYDLIMFFKFTKAYRCNIKNIEDLDKIIISDIGIDLIKTIKLQDLIAFIAYTELHRSNSVYARARKIASIKSYFKYLYKITKEIEVNVAEELESPKISKRNPSCLNLDESVELLNSIKGKNKDRDKCIITLFLNCGLRLSELCSIDVEMIRDDTISIIGKGDKERTLYLNGACIRALNKYLIIRETIQESILLDHRKALFISGKNMRISQRSVERLVKKHIYEAGLDTSKFSPHKLRHTAATLMYKHGGVDIRSIQKILGHESVSTTQIYTHVDDETLREAIHSNPLSDM
ncbi:MAG: tyrosine recombinase XerC [Clostridium sp.]